MDDKLLQDVSAVLYEYGRDRQKLEERARQVIEICGDDKTPECQSCPDWVGNAAQLWWNSGAPAPHELPVIATIAATAKATAATVVFEDVNLGTGEYATRSGKKIHMSRITHYARIKF